MRRSGESLCFFPSSDDGGCEASGRKSTAALASNHKRQVVRHVVRHWRVTIHLLDSEEATRHMGASARIWDTRFSFVLDFFTPPSQSPAFTTLWSLHRAPRWTSRVRQSALLSASASTCPSFWLQPVTLSVRGSREEEEEEDKTQQDPRFACPSVLGPRPGCVCGPPAGRPRWRPLAVRTPR